MINLSQQPLLDTSTYVHIGTYMNKKKLQKIKEQNIHTVTTMVRNAH